MTTDKGKAETLNRFFVQSLHQKIDLIYLVKNLGHKEQEPLEITDDMVEKVITKLKTDKSPGFRHERIHNQV